MAKRPANHTRWQGSERRISLAHQLEVTVFSNYRRSALAAAKQDPQERARILHALLRVRGYASFFGMPVWKVLAAVMVLGWTTWLPQNADQIRRTLERRRDQPTRTERASNWLDDGAEQVDERDRRWLERTERDIVERARKTWAPAPAPARPRWRFWLRGEDEPVTRTRPDVSGSRTREQVARGDRAAAHELGIVLWDRYLRTAPPRPPSSAEDSASIEALLRHIQLFAGVLDIPQWRLIGVLLERGLSDWALQHLELLREVLEGRREQLRTMEQLLAYEDGTGGPLAEERRSWLSRQEQLILGA